jgi:hypothetical protein
MNIFLIIIDLSGGALGQQKLIRGEFGECCRLMSLYFLGLLSLMKQNNSQNAAFVNSAVIQKKIGIESLFKKLFQKLFTAFLCYQVCRQI